MSRKGKTWTEDEMFFVKNNYSSSSTVEMSEVLGRGVYSIAHMARKLGVKKTDRVRDAKEGYRICSRCDKEKSLSSYYKNVTKPLGIDSRCIECVRESQMSKRRNVVELESKIASDKDKRNQSIINKKATDGDIFNCIGCGEYKKGIEFGYSIVKDKRNERCLKCTYETNETYAKKRIIEGRDW